MGKGSGGAAWWAFLLLASVLVATAAAAATEAGAEENLDERREDRRPWCKKDCEWQYGEDTPRKRECESRCGHKEADADAESDVDEVDNGQCQWNCMRDGDPRLWCIDRCDRSGDDQCQWRCERYGDPRLWCMQQCQRGDALDDDNNNRGNLWQRQCQHYHNWDKRQQCLRRCRHGWETMAGAILAVV